MQRPRTPPVARTQQVTRTPLAYDEQAPLRTREVVQAWWPLTASWVLMTGELLLTTAVVSRLVDPQLNLAAWGVVFNLAITIQAPSVMLLTASTALVRGRSSYRWLHRVALWMGAGLTLLHLLVAFTPLYEVVMFSWLGVPQEVGETARLATALVVPWSLGTGMRRFYHGLLIRRGHSRGIVAGSALRLGVDAVGLTIGALLGWPGAAMAAGVLSTAVLSEAVYSMVLMRRLVRPRQLPEAANDTPLTLPGFLSFYVPLATTTVLTMLTTSVISGAVARMPNSLASLAVWPVAMSFLHVMQAPGMSFAEVVITYLRRPGAMQVLVRTALWVGLGSTLVLVALAATPLALWWFGAVAGLSPELARMASTTMWFALLLPATRLVQHWLQGRLVAERRTRPMMESVVVFSVVTAAVLVWGVASQRFTGVYVGLSAFVVGLIAQTAWMALRAGRGTQLAGDARPTGEDGPDG